MRQETMEKLTQAVADRLGVGIDRLKVTEVVKDNGIRLTGITLTGRNVGAMCYVNGFEEDLESGEITMEEAAMQIAGGLNYIPDGVREQAEQLKDMDKDTFLDGIRIRLLNAARNEDAKAQYPYFDFMDLIGVFHYKMGETASVRVTYALAEMIGVTLEELKAAGMRNTEKDKKVMPLAQMMNNLAPGNDDAFEGGVPLWVFTNREAYFGASIMLIADPFEELSQKLETDLFILPSSKHEVLVLPKEQGDEAGLSGMVREINGSVVSGEDFLSDTIYQYTRGSGVIDIVA